MITKAHMAFLCFLSLLSASHHVSAATADRPNVIFILADDMGYGAIQANNDKNHLPTPNLNRLVKEGMNFTDAHSDASVCTPSRYGLLTGRYSWRSGLKSGVTWSFYPSLIEPELTTVAEMFQQQDYHTACIGKWHLGIDFYTKEGKTLSEATGFSRKDMANAGVKGNRPAFRAKWEDIDFSKAVSGGPTDHGFDYYFGDDLPNMPPYAFFKNDRLTAMPTTIKPNGMFGAKGPMVPGWKLEDVMPKITADARQYIKTHAKEQDPFFMYFALTSPHTPIVPSKEFIGKSGLDSKYADWIIETDWAVGEVLKELDAQGIAENTIVVFSTDNGPTELKENKDLITKGTDLIHQYKGMKRSLWEGGHRVPYIVRWPAKTPAASTCDEPICLNDFMATMAELTDFSLKDDMAVDSYSILDLYKGQKKKLARSIIHHDFNGGFSIRQGDWKLNYFREIDLEKGKDSFKKELYNLKKDIKETNNVIGEHTPLVTELDNAFEKIVRNGRSTQGTKQKNTEHPEWKVPITTIN